MSSKSSAVGFVGCDGGGRHSVMSSRSGFFYIVSRLGARERIVTAWNVASFVAFGVVVKEVEGARVVMWREIR